MRKSGIPLGSKSKFTSPLGIAANMTIGHNDAMAHSLMTLPATSSGGCHLNEIVLGSSSNLIGIGTMAMTHP